MTDNQLQIIDTTSIMPVADSNTMKERYRIIKELTESVMTKDRDYGVIPGTKKPTLLKPGAEKLCAAFGLYPEFERLSWPDYSMMGATDDVPFILYEYRCTLKSRDGRFTVGQGVGSCNSWEKKYRYRTVYENKATDWDKEVGRLEQRKSRSGSYYNVYVIPNPDIADVINTLDKMAQKRALIAATLIAVGASEFFTQDIEDLFSGATDAEYSEAPAAPQNAPQQATAPAQQAQTGSVSSADLDLNIRVTHADSTLMMTTVFAIVSENDPGCNNSKHYINRWQKRFGVNKLNEIDVTLEDFIAIMSVSSEDYAANQ